MRTQTEHVYRSRILGVLVHIQGHLDEDLPLEGLARVAHFSPYHFHRVFRGMVGESVKEHVRRLRLERAAHRLKSCDQPIMQVAFEAGYESHEAFTRAFSTMFGASPSRYRASKRAFPFQDVPSRVHFVPNGKPPDFHPLTATSRPMDVRIETVPIRKVAFMRHIGSYRQVGETWAKLVAWAAPRGLLNPGTLRIGVAYDDRDVTPLDKLRYDACIVVEESFAPRGEVGVQEVGGGEFAMMIHRGPYETIGQSYAQLYGEWLPSSGREARSAPGFALFLNAPPETAPQDLLTEIYLPLERVCEFTSRCAP